MAPQFGAFDDEVALYIPPKRNPSPIFTHLKPTPYKPPPHHGIKSRITRLRYQVTFRPIVPMKEIPQHPSNFILKAMQLTVKKVGGILHSYEIKPYLFVATVSIPDNQKISHFLLVFFSVVKKLSPFKFTYNKLAANCYVRTVSAEDDEEYQAYVYWTARWHQIREKIAGTLAKDTNHNYNYITKQQALDICPDLVSLLRQKRVKLYRTAVGDLIHITSLEVIYQYNIHKYGRKVIVRRRYPYNELSVDKILDLVTSRPIG